MWNFIDAIMDKSRELIIFLDSRGKIVEVGKKTLDVLGYSREELRGQPFDNLFDKGYVFETGAVKINFKSSLGELIPASINVSEVMESNCLHYAVIGELLMPERTYEEEQWHAIVENKFKEKEEKYHVLLDESSDPIFSFEPDGTYIYVNSAFSAPFGMKPQDISGRRIWDIFSKDEAEKRFHIVKKVFETGIMENIEVRVPQPGGDLFFLTTVKPIKDADGSVKFVICISKNITEMKKIREELMKAKENAEAANRSKSEFLSNMSHEIRTPLNAIIGFSELLKPKAIDKTSVEYLNGIIIAGKNLLNIINDILDLSKIEAGKMEINYAPTNIYRIFNELNQIFSYQAKNKNLSLIFDIEESIPKYLMLDEIRIRQVLLNLVGNAMKFTEQGYVRVRASKVFKTKELNNIDLKFEVEDSGMGIAEDQLAKIFMAFCQQDGQSIGKYGGTGLGLTISQRLAAAMNGNISVSSRLGEGSIFRMELADVIVTDGENIKEDNSDYHNDEIKFMGSKILYAEDMEPNRQVIKGFTDGINLVMYEAQNGLEAINIANREMPDLILMDIHMPVMDGFMVYKRLQEDVNLKSIPVIALTASAMENEARVLREKFADVLTKPFSKDDLINVLKKFLPHERQQKVVKQSNYYDFEKISPDIVLDTQEMETLKSSLRRIEEGMVIDDMLECAKWLCDIGKKYKSNFYEEISKHLKDSANNCNVIEIERSIERLKKV